MLARSLVRAASSAGIRARGGVHACASSFAEARFASSFSVSNSPLTLRCFAVSLPQQGIGVRHRSSSRPPLDGKVDEDDLVDGEYSIHASGCGKSCVCVYLRAFRMSLVGIAPDEEIRNYCYIKPDRLSISRP